MRNDYALWTLVYTIKQNIFCCAILIHISNIRICVISHGQPAGCCLSICPPVLCGKNFTLHLPCKLLSQTFMPTMLVGTIDFYHFIPLSITLTLTGGHRLAQSKIFWLHFLMLFNWMLWSFEWWWSNNVEHPGTVWLRLTEWGEVLNGDEAILLSIRGLFDWD